MNSEKRQQNREYSKKLLKERGIHYEEFNNGYHLKIGRIDFWPGTGKFIDPDAKNELGIGRGVHNLLQYLTVKQAASTEPAILNSMNVDQLFEIAKHSKDKSLYGICESIHAAIYNNQPKGQNQGEANAK